MLLELECLICVLNLMLLIKISEPKVNSESGAISIDVASQEVGGNFSLRHLSKF